jgi:DNA-binding ferritin-like protein
MAQLNAGPFIGNLLHSATVTHMMHFRAVGEGSYARHIALGEYYDGIVGLVDTLAETIQGCYAEIIEDYPTTFTSMQTEPIEYMAALKEYVAEKRTELPQQSNIQNEIDNIATLIDSTLYKLTFLR